jgi:hypothetical protein
LLLTVSVPVPLHLSDLLQGIVAVSGLNKQGGSVDSPFDIRASPRRLPIFSGLGDQSVLATFLVGLMPRIQVGAWASINLSKCAPPSLDHETDRCCSAVERMPHGFAEPVYTLL